jgi:hypothetical protein
MEALDLPMRSKGGKRTPGGQFRGRGQRELEQTLPQYEKETGKDGDDRRVGETMRLVVERRSG